jgi:hypothetical protein
VVQVSQVIVDLVARELPEAEAALDGELRLVEDDVEVVAEEARQDVVRPALQPVALRHVRLKDAKNASIFPEIKLFLLFLQ